MAHRAGNGLIGAYPSTLLLGVSAYFTLRNHLEPRLVNCALTGAIIAALPWILLTFIGGTPDQAAVGERATVIDGAYTAYGWLLNAQFFGQIGLAGAAGGALFWAIAAAGNCVEKSPSS